MKLKSVLLLTLAFFVFLLLPVMSFAHGIERKPETADLANYSIAFQTEPQYLVTRKTTHFDMVVKDSQTNEIVSNLNLSLELHQQDSEEFVTLPKGLEEEPGHYGFSYVFPEKGIWEVHLDINGQKLEKEFIIEVDNFGLSGLLRSGLILILALLLILVAYWDCRKNITPQQYATIT